MLSFIHTVSQGAFDPFSEMKKLRLGKDEIIFPRLLSGRALNQGFTSALSFGGLDCLIIHLSYSLSFQQFKKQSKDPNGNQHR